MAEIDLITALGRMLGNGIWRDRFAEDPHALAEQFRLRESDREAFTKLRVEDLEFQARILLRKRYALLRHFFPHTCKLIGSTAAHEFESYARTPESGVQPKPSKEALSFCEHVRSASPERVCGMELNRLRFEHGTRKIAWHFVWIPNPSPARRPGMQILVRQRQGTSREWLLYF